MSQGASSPACRSRPLGGLVAGGSAHSWACEASSSCRESFGSSCCCAVAVATKASSLALRPKTRPCRQQVSLGRPSCSTKSRPGCRSRLGARVASGSGHSWVYEASWPCRPRRVSLSFGDEWASGCGALAVAAKASWPCREQACFGSSCHAAAVATEASWPCRQSFGRSGWEAREGLPSSVPRSIWGACWQSLKSVVQRGHGAVAQANLQWRENRTVTHVQTK